MKKLLVIFAFLPLVYMPMQAQINSDDLANGVVHYIADAYLSAGDSIHTMGTFQVIDSRGFMYDSLRILVGYNDSLRHTLYIERNYGLGATVFTDTVEVEPSAGSALYYVQTTAAGATVYNWANGLLATAPFDSWYIRVKVKVHTVGSEVASSSKKFSVKVVGFLKKRS